MAQQNQQNQQQRQQSSNNAKTAGRPDDRPDAASPGDPGTAGRSPADFEKVGPRSIEGVEASDLPDKGRGTVNTNFGKEAARNVPHHTGETVGPDALHQTGLRGTPDLSDADQHGHG
jgi:hypothetical protein